MPTPTVAEIHALEQRVHDQRAKEQKLRRRVIQHGGRRKAPRLFKAYQRARFERVALEDSLTKAKHAQQVSTHMPLRLKALHVAQTQVGVMETGGNNMGIPYVRYERSNYAVAPEPWCGDFMAWCYRQAGSKRVSRSWAGVPLIRGLAGITVTAHPRPGDLVRFEFTGDQTPDHVGMFVRWVDEHTIETIEGNTGSTGAVSDSKTGGDGVYLKHRPVTLVRDYLAVHG